MVVAGQRDWTGVGQWEIIRTGRGDGFYLYHFKDKRTQDGPRKWTQAGRFS